MDRHREIAASPVRTVGAAWTAITDLAVSTLDQSPNIDGGDVRRTFDAVAAAGHALVAGGQLNDQPLILAAAPLQLAFRTVSGEGAFRTLEDENLNPVPGAATASDWMLYLPRPAGLAALVDEVAAGVAHVSTTELHEKGADGVVGASTTEPREKAAPDGFSAPPTIDLRRLDPKFWESKK